MHQVDIAHLTFKPPFAPGSYNRLVGTQIEQIRDLRQVVISYWDQPLPEGAEISPAVILVSDKGLPFWQKAYLHLPERVRKHWFNGVSGRGSLIHLWQILRILQQLKPKVIVCYDNYKFGSLLRRKISWPCQIILSQHSLSYHLSQEVSAQLYSLKSFDIVWVLTRASYRLDRHRLMAYEPLVQVLPNWIDTKKFKPVSEEEKSRIRAQWGLPHDRPIVLWLSRLVPKKGAHVILQSWPKILQRSPGAFLWVVGGGDLGYERYLKSLVQALGITQTACLQGEVSPGLTALCYQASDIYLFPTLFNGEAFGLSLLEGMACGLACAASDQEILRELYSEEAVRLVPDPNIEDAFVDPVVTLLCDTELRHKMGKAARSLVEQAYCQDKVLPKVKEFYRRQISLAGG